MKKIIFITLFAATTIIWSNANAQNNQQSILKDPPTDPTFPPHHRIMPSHQTPDQTFNNRQVLRIKLDIILRATQTPLTPSKTKTGLAIQTKIQAVPIGTTKIILIDKRL